MAEIVFYKICGTGNDFIVIDNRMSVIKRRAAFAEKVCERRMNIGADGVLFLENSKKADVQIRIFNANGSEAEMCGNGIRCAAWIAHHKLGMSATTTIETMAGVLEPVVSKNVVCVKMTKPTDFRDYAPIEVADDIFYFYFINTGVPHCVIFEDKLDDFPVDQLGREIRHHDHFEPEGTNVNFVHVLNKKEIRVRTYERGVEAETLACGTGSTAAAIISVLVGKCEAPVVVETRSGEKITVDFTTSKFEIDDVSMKGPVAYVCQGVIAE